MVKREERKNNKASVWNRIVVVDGAGSWQREKINNGSKNQEDSHKTIIFIQMEVDLKKQKDENELHKY